MDIDRIDDELSTTWVVPTTLRKLQEVSLDLRFLLIPPTELEESMDDPGLIRLRCGVSVDCDDLLVQEFFTGDFYQLDRTTMRPDWHSFAVLSDQNPRTAPPLPPESDIRRAIDQKWPGYREALARARDQLEAMVLECQANWG